MKNMLTVSLALALSVAAFSGCKNENSKNLSQCSTNS